jgi:hypothetical protein
MDIYKPKMKICVSGAAETGHCAPKSLDLSLETGREIAKHDCVLVTGATSGIPYWSAKGAKEKNGLVIGLSPALNEREHIEKYKLPIDYHDLIIYTGYGFSGRDIQLTHCADAILVICGRMGTLHEFTTAFEEDKLIGVLEGTGGMADMVREIIAKSFRGPGRVIFNTNPKDLIEDLIKLINEEKELNKK